jgi:hypothetical protein
MTPEALADKRLGVENLDQPSHFLSNMSQWLRGIPLTQYP